MFTLQIKWNRELNYNNYSDYANLCTAVAIGDSMQASDDEVKDFRVLDENGVQVYPKESTSRRAPSKDPKEIQKKYIDQELHLYKGWINAPSSLQPFHELHGSNVIITKIGDKCKVVLLKELSAMSQFEIDPMYLAFGDWNKSQPSEFEFELFGMKFKRVPNGPSSVESPCRQCWFCNPTGDGCCLSHQFSDVLPCQDTNGKLTTHFERTDLKY